MPEPAFTQPERRNYALPIAAAAIALALALAVAIHFFPATTVNSAHVSVAVVPAQTLFTNKSMVVGQAQVEQTLYIAETMRIDNQLRTALYLDNFTLTLKTAQGELTTTAIAADDLQTVRTSFPALEPLLTKPLLRETRIEPGKQAEGVVLFSLRIPQSLWDTRESAMVKVDIYHQYPVYQTIPKS